MRLTNLLLFLPLLGCGEFRTIGYVDPEFRPHVEKFLEITNISNINVDMYFHPDTGEFIGVCIIRGQYKDIIIDMEYWKQAGYVDREILIFHELGHCVLMQDHRDFKLQDNCPGSIMNTYHIGEYCYDKHYDYYIEELLRW